MSGPDTARDAGPLARWARVLVAAACATPLLTGWGLLLYPHVTGKALFVRTVGLLALPILAGLLASGCLRRVRAASAVTVAAALAAAVHLASIPFGNDVARGVWESQARMLGVTTLGPLAAVFAVAVLALPDRDAWRTPLRVFLATGAAVCLIGVAEAIGVVPGMDAFEARASSTLGNPAFLAGYAILVAFVAWTAAARATRRRERILCGATAALAAVVTVSTQTRASAAALACGAAVAASAYLVGLADRPRTRRWIGAGLAALALCASGFWAVRGSPAFADVPLLGRFAALRSDSRDVERRILLWKTAVDAGLERPVLGWGPGTYGSQFDRRYPPRLWRLDPANSFADRAHCVPANTFAEQGTLGLLAGLALAAAPVLLLLRRHERGETDLHALASGFGVSAALFAHRLFVFDDVATLTASALWLAYVHGDRPHEPPGPAPAAPRAAALRTALAAGAVVAAVLAVPLVARPAVASLRQAQAIDAVRRGAADAVARVDAAEAAAEPGSCDYPALLAETVTSALPAYRAAGRDDEARLLLARAYGSVAAARRVFSSDIRALLAQADVVRALALEFGDASHAEACLLRLRAAASICSSRPDVHLATAAVALAAGQPELAERHADLAVDAEPFAAESVWRAAEALAAAGRLEKARGLARQALGAGIEFEGRGRETIERLLR